MFEKNYDFVHWYVGDIGAQVVAKSGIPTDRHHIGKLIAHCLKQDPEFLHQIDGATGQTETNGSILERSLRCAVAFQKLGFKKDDVIVLMSPNYLDVTVTFHAALFLGVMIAPVDVTLGVNELNTIFDKNRPKMVFCENDEKADEAAKALEMSNIKGKIFTLFGKRYTTLEEIMKVVTDEEVKNFVITDFDPEETVALLISTSGTTGFPKTAMLTHKNLAIGIPYLWQGFTKFPTPTRMVLVVSPMQWLSAGFHFLFAPILKCTRLQTSAAVTVEHFGELVDKYRPTYIATGPNQMASVTTSNCDMTCFELVILGGSAVSVNLMDRVKEKVKSPNVYTLYGQTECSGLAIYANQEVAPGSAGRLASNLEFRLVKLDTLEDINEPHVEGELWMKGPTVFKGYYNNPEATAAAITEDGWLRSGDIFYRDEHHNYYFVDRCKLLLKYRNHHVAPVEIEKVIMQHPEVLDVAVTGIPDEIVGDLVVACVIPKPGCNPTAQEIKDLVKNSLLNGHQAVEGRCYIPERVPCHQYF